MLPCRAGPGQADPTAIFVLNIFVFKITGSQFWEKKTQHRAQNLSGHDGK